MPKMLDDCPSQRHHSQTTHLDLRYVVAFQYDASVAQPCAALDDPIDNSLARFCHQILGRHV